VTPAQRAQLEQGVLAHEPGAKVASASCGSGDQGGCTVYVRKPGAHRCDGWLAQFDSTGAVAVIGVGHRAC
jgi:hypothetical protein